MTRRIAGAVTILFALVVFASTAQAQMSCAEAQNRFSDIGDTKAFGVASPFSKSWADVQKSFGVPARTEEDKPSAGSTILTYQFNGCELQFVVGPSGKVTTKNFALRAAALGVPANAAADPASAPLASLSPASVTEMSAAIRSMEQTLAQLQGQIQTLQISLATIKAQLSTSTAAAPAKPFTSPPFGTPAPVPATAPAKQVTPVSPPASPTPTASATQIAKPLCSESGSCYGDISEATGKAKTVYVPGYTRKDGTYVRGYYRSK